MDMNQAIDQANQANNTSVWLMLTFFIFAPILVLFAAVIAVIIKQHGLKCPKCGNWRKNRTAVQTVKADNKITTKRIVICRKCENEFLV